jgi:hypothetical protein
VYTTLCLPVFERVANAFVPMGLDLKEFEREVPSNVADLVTEHAYSIGFCHVAKFEPPDTGLLQSLSGVCDTFENHDPFAPRSKFSGQGESDLTWSPHGLQHWSQ